MSGMFRMALGVFAAALAGGLALGGEIAIYMAVEAIGSGEGVALPWLSGLIVGLYAAMFFVAGLTFIGLPVLFGLRAMKRPGPVSAVIAGAIGAAAVVLGMMALGGVTDAALGFAVFLIPPGGLCAWVLWRIAFRPVPVV